MNHWEEIWKGLTLADSPAEAVEALNETELRGLANWLRGKGAETGLKALVLGLLEVEACERFLKG